MASSKVLLLFLSTLSLFVCFPILIQAEVVHITVVTIGYTNVRPSTRLEYQCYRSEPDRDALLSFGRSAPITTDRSPPTDVQQSSGYPFIRLVGFPTGDGWDRDGFGPFYCEASKPERDITRVTTFFQRYDAKFISSDELFTKTVNVNDTGVMISMTIRYNPEASDNVITWMKDGNEVLTLYDGQTQISFPNPIQTSDRGIYEIYYDNERHQSRGGLYRLIVRECPAGKWGPPECYGICDKCYNGGICDDKSGLCICPNNFKGPSCLEICRTSGGNRYGLNCEFRCSYPFNAATQCHGNLFCLPDPYGCSCDVGAHGLACNTHKTYIVDAFNNDVNDTSYTPYDGSTDQIRSDQIRTDQIRTDQGASRSRNLGYSTQGMQEMFANGPATMPSTVVDIDSSVQTNDMYREGGVEPPNYIVQNVMVLLFCSLIFGLIGVVKGSMVNFLYRSGNTSAAEAASLEAGRWFWVGLVVGILRVILIVCLVAI